MIKIKTGSFIFIKEKKQIEDFEIYVKRAGATRSVSTNSCNSLNISIIYATIVTYKKKKIKTAQYWHINKKSFQKI